MNYIRKRITTYVFILVITLPILLACISKLFGVKIDVGLNGYTDQLQPVEITAENFWNESYQDYVNDSLGSRLPLYGVMVKTYNTLQYYAFRTGNALIGQSDYLFYKDWLDDACLDEYDYSSEVLNDEMQNLVDNMSSLQRKLNAIGKQLFIYVAPNKVRYCSDYLPEKYQYMYQNATNNSMEVFESKLIDAEIPYFFCWEIDDQLVYPEYYTGSFHWSRTYEQLCTKNIIEELNNLSGKNYRNIVISGVKKSEDPFWRDDDFFNLLDIYGNQSCQQYYEYITTSQDGNNFDVLNVMIQGDSYAQGLEKDILDNISEDNVIYINRDEFVRFNSLTDSVPIYHDFDNLDFQKYIDLTDIVIIELFESNLKENYIIDFIQHLDSYLDTYIDSNAMVNKSMYYPSQLDFTSIQNDDLYFARGLYSLEDGFCWTKKQCSVAINDSIVGNEGLQLDFYVPEQVFAEDNIITIKVNGVEVYRDINLGGDTSIKIATDNLPEASENIYTIDIIASEDFCPKDLGINDDERALALRLKYVGGIK